MGCFVGCWGCGWLFFGLFLRFVWTSWVGCVVGVGGVLWFTLVWFVRVCLGDRDSGNGFS